MKIKINRNGKEMVNLNVKNRGTKISFIEGFIIISQPELKDIEAVFDVSIDTVIVTPTLK